MNSRTDRYYPLIIGVAFILALFLRLAYLNAQPLSDSEAIWALQSFGIAKGSGVTLGGQPLYLLVTGVLFYIFGNDNFLARLLPALAGSLLVLAPVLFSNQLGKRASLWLTFGLALDPGLVALSRQAGSSIPGIAFTILAVGFILQNLPILAGICTGLAILGGSTLWPGWIGIGLAWIIYRNWLNKPVKEDEQPTTSRFKIGNFFLAFGVTLFLIGTLFFRVPQGLSALGSSVTAYLSGWSRGGGVSISYLLAGIAAYSLLAIPVGLWSAIRAWVKKDATDQLLSIWLLIEIVLTIAYPARQMSDAGWILVPLWVLAARGLSRLPRTQPENRIPVNIFMLIAIVILFFTWLSFTGFLLAWQNNTGDQQIRGFALTGALVMLALATILVGWGWSSVVAGMGLTRAALVMLVIYLVFGSVSAAGWRYPPTAEIWQPYPQPQAQQSLLETVGDLSLWNTGRKDSIEIVVLGISSPSLQWELRGMPNARFSETLQQGSQPPLVLTPESQQPELAASYRGQPFVWDISPDWSGMTWFDRINWLAFHFAPVRKQMTILWARTDLFLDRNPTGSAPSSTSP